MRFTNGWESAYNSLKMKRFLAILAFLFLLFILALAVYLVNQQTRSSGRAAQVGVLSLENSYIFASPLLASANGVEKIRITIFALDSQGIGVPDKSVQIGRTPNLSLESVQSVTDRVGKAVFDVSSPVAAEYLIEVQIDGKTLPQKLKVIFKSP